MVNLHQLPRPRGTYTNDKPHPSRGGNPYSNDMRDDVVTRWRIGQPLDTPELNALRNEYKYPSIWSCERWIEQVHQVGHCRPKFATGNHDPFRDVNGQALVRLAMYRAVHPESSLDHAKAFLVNMDPTLPPFCSKAIVKAEKLLDLRRKASSTTCERAYWPRNLHKRRMFWEMDYPFGSRNIRTQDMIDMDESGFKIEHSNHNFGKTVSWLRCHFEGEYNRDRKLNCMMGVSADRAYNMEWHDLWEQDEGGTNLYRVWLFFDRIMDQLDRDWPGRSFCFTMDNLNIHHNPIILNRIIEKGHKYLFRAPYWSVDGPMEYVFNTIHTHLLQHFKEIGDLVVLENVLGQIIARLTNFIRYFLHVGFPDT